MKPIYLATQNENMQIWMQITDNYGFVFLRTAHSFFQALNTFTVVASLSICHNSNLFQ